jgi:hypothetical protein
MGRYTARLPRTTRLKTNDPQCPYPTPRPFYESAVADKVLRKDSDPFSPDVWLRLIGACMETVRAPPATCRLGRRIRSGSPGSTHRRRRHTCYSRWNSQQSSFRPRPCHSGSSRWRPSRRHRLRAWRPHHLRRRSERHPSATRTRAPNTRTQTLTKFVSPALL